MKIRVGIVTFFHSVNYGAYLQAYALCNRLNKEPDIQAELVNFRMPVEIECHSKFTVRRKNILLMNYNRRREKCLEVALQEQTLSQPALVTSSLKEFSDFVYGKYDILIAGSDEIWKADGYRGFPTPYFLPSDLGARKLAYAASGRTPFSVLSEENQKILKDYLDDFEWIGVRDDKTYKEVLQVVDDKSKVYMTYDPTLVYGFKPNRDRGRLILKNRYHIDVNKTIIGVMYSEDWKSKDGLTRYLRKNFKDVELVSLFEWTLYAKNTPGLPPLDWVDVIAAMDGVVTMYFHAICFSLIGGTPFVAIENRAPNNEESKLYDLLQNISRSERYFFGKNDAIESGKIDELVRTARSGIRDDNRELLCKAEQSFDTFLDVIRKG